MKIKVASSLPPQLEPISDTLYFVPIKGACLIGELKYIQIIRRGKNRNIPFVIREALVGLKLTAVLKGEAIHEAFRGCMLVYIHDIVDAFIHHGRFRAAALIKQHFPHKYDLYAFDRSTFRGQPQA